MAFRLDNLKVQRELVGLTQSELARLAVLNVQTIFQMEAPGGVPGAFGAACSGDVIQRIIAALTDRRRELLREAALLEGRPAEQLTADQRSIVETAARLRASFPERQRSRTAIAVDDAAMTPELLGAAEMG